MPRRRPRRISLGVLAIFAIVVTGVSSGASSPPGKSPPVLRTPPSITGAAVEGRWLTASPGEWSGRVTKYAFYWARCDAGGGECAAISGARAVTLVLSAMDVGKTLRVTVIATNKNGSGVATSAPSAVVTAAAPAPAPAPAPPPPSPPPAPTPPETVVTSVVCGATGTASCTDGNNNGGESILVKYSVSNADSAEIQLGSGQPWRPLGTSPAGSWVDASCSTITISVRAKRSSDGAVDTSPASQALSVTPYEGCASSPPPSPPPAMPSEPTYSPSRRVYCLGDANWVYGGSTDSGWWYDGTSTGWVRNATGPKAERVDFDNSVTVMQSVVGNYGAAGAPGPCQTVKAEVRPTDPKADYIASPAQAATLALIDPNASYPFYRYDTSTSILPKHGETWWYGMAFATNPEYRPSQGEWNNVFAWHNAVYSNPTGSNLLIGVTTIGASGGADRWRCGDSLSQLPQPRIYISLDGGDVNYAPSDSAQATCRRYVGPVFQAGQRYRISMRIKWNAYRQGEVSLWINDVQYINEVGISTWWRKGDSLDSVYPLLENYRKYDSSLPTNIVYYGGMIRGSTAADVAIP